MSRNADIITVVTCDIVKSKAYASADRARIQEHLLASWKDVQARFAAKLDSELGFRVTAGDEFQFVCKDVKTAFDAVTFLRIKMRCLDVKPLVTFRASIGIGERTVSGQANPYAQDGPAFRLARQGMEKLKASSRNLTIVSKATPSKAIETVNAVLPLADLIYEGWSSAQARAIELAFDGFTQERIAAQLGVIPSTVSHRLSRAEWDAYHIGINSLKEWLLPEDDANAS